MKILLIKPMEKPIIAEIGNDLENMQKTVGGLIQEIMPWEDPVALVCNDEGKIAGFTPNRILYDDEGRAYDVIAGDFFICGIDEENFTDIPENLIEKYYEKFRVPEIII